LFLFGISNKNNKLNFEQITLVIPTFIKSKKTRRNTFLLVGLCDSGKTTLYHQVFLFSSFCVD